MMDAQTLKVIKELHEFEDLAKVNGSIIGDICRLAITEIERLCKNRPEEYYDCCDASTQGLHSPDCTEE